MDEQLYEKLRNVDQEFIASVEFGLIILDEAGHMLHFCVCS